MKMLILVMLCALMQVTPVKAAMVDGMVGETGKQEVAVEIPDVVGMKEADAVAALENVVLSDGSELEIIKNYSYSDEVEADVVYEQYIEWDTKNESDGAVHISISLGKEPAETLTTVEQTVSTLSTFGLGANQEKYISEDSRLGLEWKNVPHSFEYNWDNSENCWQHGVWMNGECYKTPRGEYSTDVRHKVQGYCDGTYAYIRIIFSRDYGAKANGDDYNFNIDGQQAKFCIRLKEGNVITGNTGRLEHGTHEVEVRHGDGSISGQAVPGAVAYLTKHPHDYNAELEFKIPLSEMKRQNSNIDLDNIGEIKFRCPNLMYRWIKLCGASTFPMASAAAALLLIPGSTVVLKKRKGKKNAGKANE